MMQFDIPRGVVFPVDRLDIRLLPGPHPFAVENREAIDANWLRETAALPALFDGEVILLAALRFRDAVLEGTCHLVHYRTFLYWRGSRAQTAEHIFAHAVPVTADDALLAIRMASTTANAGRVYFAAGSFDRQDIVDGRVDMAANMRREVREETGLDLGRTQAERRVYALSLPIGTVLFQRHRFGETATHLARRVAAHVEVDPDPEITGPVIIRSRSDVPESAMPHIPPLVDWHFANAFEA